MTSPLFAVYGASGCGRGVLPLARAQLQRQGVPGTQLVFVDDQPEASVVNGQRVLRYAEFLYSEAGARHAVLAIADSAVREKLAVRCAADGVQAWTVVAVNVVTMDEVTLGEGAVLCPFVTLTSNIRIGRHFHANLYSYVEHDCVIGDFVTFAQGSSAMATSSSKTMPTSALALSSSRASRGNRWSSAEVRWLAWARSSRAMCRPASLWSATRGG